MNTYFNGLEWHLFNRLFITPSINGLIALKNRNKIKWEDWSISDSAYVMWAKTLEAVLSNMFREARMFSDPLLNFWSVKLKGWTTEYWFASAINVLENRANWVWRYLKVPGTDLFHLDYTEQADDVLSTWVMLNKDTNAMLKKAAELSDAASIESLLEDKGSYFLRNILTAVPVLWYGAKTHMSKTVWSAEMNLKRIADLVVEDPVAKDLWAGKWNSWILNDSKLVKNIWNDLSSHNYYNKAFVEWWVWYGLETDIEYGVEDKQRMSQVEEKMFMEDIAKELWYEKTQDFIDNINKGRTKKYRTDHIIKALWVAEAMKPWAGRVMVSYLAWKRMSDLKKFYKDKRIQMTDKMTEDARKLIINELYPHIATVDKQSWVQTTLWYIESKQPGNLKWILGVQWHNMVIFI